MRIAATAIFALTLLAIGPDARVTQRTAGGLVDLGHPLSAADPTWSGTPVFTHTIRSTFEKHGMLTGRFATDEHFGTHVDAPAHFAKSGWTVDQIPVDRLIRSGFCISVEDQAARDEDYRVTSADIEGFEATHGRIPEGAFVFIATGWDARWPSTRYMNIRDGVKHFPGLTEGAALQLARDRRVAGIGIDTPSVDYGPSTAYEAHRASQPLNVYHVENARGLTALPPSGFEVIVAPVKITGVSGAPTRVFARLPGR